MDLEKTETLHGLYGSQINRSKAVGYCRRHSAALTVRTLKHHECLNKQCFHLKKYEEHDYWRQHEQKKMWRKSNKQKYLN